MRLIICIRCKRERPYYSRDFCKSCYHAWLKINNPDHHQRRLERERNYYRENIERFIESRKKWRRENPEKRAASRKKHLKKWYATEHGKMKKREYRFRRRLNGRVSAKDLRRVVVENLIKFGVNACEKCKIPTKESYDLDHIIPISKGGNHSYENLQLLCRKCNQEKGVQLISYLV